MSTQILIYREKTHLTQFLKAVLTGLEQLLHPFITSNKKEGISFWNFYVLKLLVLCTVRRGEEGGRGKRCHDLYCGGSCKRHALL